MAAGLNTRSVAFLPVLSFGKAKQVSSPRLNVKWDEIHQSQTSNHTSTSVLSSQAVLLNAPKPSRPPSAIKLHSRPAAQIELVAESILKSCSANQPLRTESKNASCIKIAKSWQEREGNLGRPGGMSKSIPKER